MPVRIVGLEPHLDPYFRWMSFSTEQTRRGEFYSSFKRAVDLSIAEGADMVLFPGDLFDRVRPGMTSMIRTIGELTRLKKAGIKAFAVPGHHDRPKTSGVPSPLHLYSRAGVLRLFERMDEIEVDEVSVDGTRVCIGGYGYNPFLVGDRVDPLADVRPSQGFDGDLNILMVHNAIEGFSPARGEEQVIRRSSVPEGVDLVVAGHLHQHKVEWGEPVICYVGTTQRVSFAEEGERKGCVLIEADQDGVKRIEFKENVARELHTLQVEVPESGQLTEFITAKMEREAEGMSKPKESIVRLRLTGPMTIEGHTTYVRDEILRAARRLFFDLKLEEELEYVGAFEAPSISLKSPLETLRQVYSEATQAELSDSQRRVLEEAFELASRKLEEVGGW